MLEDAFLLMIGFLSLITGWSVNGYQLDFTRYNLSEYPQNLIDDLFKLNILKINPTAMMILGFGLITLVFLNISSYRRSLYMIILSFPLSYLWLFHTAILIIDNRDFIPSQKAGDHPSPIDRSNITVGTIIAIACLTLGIISLMNYILLRQDRKNNHGK